MADSFGIPRLQPGDIVDGKEVAAPKNPVPTTEAQRDSFFVDFDSNFRAAARSAGVKPTAPESSPSVAPASMSTFFDQKKNQEGQVQFSEEIDPNLIGDGMSPSTRVETELRNLHTQKPSERARVGALFGAGVGMSQMGSNSGLGALLGASIGAMVSRGVGLAQSGEMEDQKRLQSLGSSLASMGVLDAKTGNFSIGDGIFNVYNTATLRNSNEAVAGKSERSIYETDESSPFYNRGLSMAKSLAYVMTYGVMGHRDVSKNERDRKELENTTGIFFNMLTDGADSIDIVSSRARSLSGKLGMKRSQLEQFLASQKQYVIPDDVQTLEKGVRLMFVNEEDS